MLTQDRTILEEALNEFRLLYNKVMQKSKKKSKKE